MSIKSHDFALLSTLLTSSPPLNFTDVASGLSPLQYACRLRPLKHPETELVVKKLVQGGADVSAKNTRSGKTALHYILRVRV